MHVFHFSRPVLSATLGLFVLTAAGTAARADILLDQITGGTFSQAAGDSATQVFTDLPQFTSAAIDDFTLTGAFDLTEASVLLEFTSRYAPTAVQVSIFSSVADAAASGSSLNGNTAAQQLVATGLTTVTSLGGNNVRVDVPLNGLSLSAGTYYLAVAPVQNFSNNGQLFMLANTASQPGGNNAVFVNPGGGFGPPSIRPQAYNASLRLVGNPSAPTGAVPEPGTLALATTGLLPLAGAVVRRRRA